jgi:hypothetical protein
VLIAGRIWWSNRKLINHAATIKGRTIMPAAVVIIESGAIYSTMLILLLATYACSNYAQYFFFDAVSHESLSVTPQNKYIFYESI